MNSSVPFQMKDLLNAAAAIPVNPYYLWRKFQKLVLQLDLVIIHFFSFI